MFLRLLAALLLWSCLAASSARADDEWLAPDKGLHFGVSLGIAAGGYGLSSVWLEQPRYRALAGFSVSLAAGLAKEAWDAAGHGDPSWRDITWDILGGLSGTALAWGMDLAVERVRRKRRQRACSSLALPTVRAPLQRGLAIHF
jgi:putative lipoprotein